jgi:hypothetical protein
MMLVGPDADADAALDVAAKGEHATTLHGRVPTTSADRTDVQRGQKDARGNSMAVEARLCLRRSLSSLAR